MIYSGKSRPKTEPAGSAMACLGVNDNLPGMVAGHEMPELIDAAYSPVSEQAAHYARIALIGSFPDNPAQNPPGNPAVADERRWEPPVLDMAGDREGPVAPAVKTRITLASFSSFACHAAVFSCLVFAFVADPQDQAEEAGTVVSVTMLGDAELDAMAAGRPDVVETEAAEPVQTVQAEPTQTVQAEPAESLPAEPVERFQAKPADTVRAEPAADAGAEPQQPGTVTAPEPDVLTSSVPAEAAVVQPMATPFPRTAAAIRKPEEKTVRKTPPQKMKPTAEKPGKNRIEGRGDFAGRAKRNARKGSAEGRETASSSSTASTAAGRASSSGSAAVANYPGKVRSRILRKARVPSAFRSSQRAISVGIRLTIDASGSLVQSSVARSSGYPELDRSFIEDVRRAAPFPPLPAGLGRSSWSFTLEMEFRRP